MNPCPWTLTPGLSPPEQIQVWLEEAVRPFPNPSVLDVGCCCKSAYVKPLAARSRRYVALDAHRPYLDALQAETQDGRSVEKVCGEAPGALFDLADVGNGFDVVLLLDVVEHMERAAALKTVRQAMRMARTVVVFTTLGLIPQSDDYYKLGGENWQTHRSGWGGEDFARLGFMAVELGGFHYNLPPPNNGAIWAVWREGEGGPTP